MTISKGYVLSPLAIT